ncbi:MAG: hypothetical protein AAFO95_05955 [Cyanobacteria bacterium J06600_6]
MFKNILRLLAASTSFVALLLASNSAIASVNPGGSVNQVQSPTVNLNVISPALELIGNSKTLSSHLGCSCQACVQQIQSI